MGRHSAGCARKTQDLHEIKGLAGQAPQNKTMPANKSSENFLAGDGLPNLSFVYRYVRFHLSPPSPPLSSVPLVFGEIYWGVSTRKRNQHTGWHQKPQIREYQENSEKKTRKPRSAYLRVRPDWLPILALLTPYFKTKCGGI